MTSLSPSAAAETISSRQHAESQLRPTYTIGFFDYFVAQLYIFYRFIVKRLRPVFVGGAIQIHFD